MSRFNVLIDSYYRAWFRYHPERAVDLGVEGYAHLLTPYGDDDIGALITLNEKLIDEIDALDIDELDQDQKIDLQLMYGQAIIESKQLIDTDWRVNNPSRFIPVNAIYQLTIRPVQDRTTALRERLAAIPAYLRGAKRYLLTSPEKIPAVWLDSAVIEAQEGIKYFRQLHQHPVVQPCRVSSELEQATHALEEFERFLSKDLIGLASGDFACGRVLFDMKLKYEHGLDINADQLYRLGETLHQQVKQSLTQVTQKLQGNQATEQLINKIQQDVNKDEPLLEQYKQCMLAAKAFVEEKGLVSVPDKQYLHVVTTPPFLQHQIPFAAYMDPMPTDTAQAGYYYVTPPGDVDSWGEHNKISLQHTCVHEAWPGHHLQFVTANHTARSRTLPRLINSSATLYEGWALYSEQLMYEQGFLDSDVSEFVLLKDRLWRALRIMLDVGLHVHQYTLTDCAKQMQSELGFSQIQAMADLSWYTQSPTVPMGYATGWALINETRERLRGIDEQFSLRAFHAQLLSVGSIGLPWVLRRCFGEPLWKSIRQSTFEVH